MSEWRDTGAGSGDAAHHVCVRCGGTRFQAAPPHSGLCAECWQREYGSLDRQLEKMSATTTPAPASAVCATCGHTAADHPGDGYACGGLRQIAAGVAEWCQCAGFAPASAAGSEQEPQR